MNKPKISIQVKVRQKLDRSRWKDMPVIATALLEDDGRSIDKYSRFIMNAHDGVEARWNVTGNLQGHYVRRNGYYTFWQIKIDGESVGPPMMRSQADAWLKSLREWASAGKFDKNTIIKIIPVEV